MAKGLAVRVKVCASSKAVIGERSRGAMVQAGRANWLMAPYRIRAKPKMRNVQNSYSSNSIVAMPELNLSNNIVTMYRFRIPNIPSE